MKVKLYLLIAVALMMSTVCNNSLFSYPETDDFNPTMSPGFSVLETGDDYTVIEFNLEDYEIEPVEVDGVTYYRLLHPVSGYLMNQGLPEVLSFSALVAVPKVGTVSLTDIEMLSSSTLSDFNLFPSQGFDLEIDKEKGFVIDEEFYAKNTEYPTNMIKISEPAIMRDYRLVTVNVKPFRYNPAESELTKIENLTIRLEYDRSVEGANEITRPTRRPSRDFERFYSQSTLNPYQFRNPPSRGGFQKRSIIVVHRHSNDAQYGNILNQYLNWKRDKGFEVNVVNTANYPNNNSIRNYVLNAYQNWDDPPEHLILIGNKSGNFSVPIWSILHPETYSGANVPVDTDHPYAVLEGDDDLHDIFVGRINIASPTQLATYWNKLRNYEIEPFMEETDWYERQLLVGDPRVSGVSTIYTNKYVKQVMENHNPDYTFREVYAVPFETQMQNAVNEGVGFFNFRGLESIGGWWYPNSNQVNNDNRLLNQVVLTCRTMLWSSNLHIDAFFNMGTPTSPKGSITGIGMSHVTRTAFNNSLTGGIFHGLYVDGVRTMGEALMRGKLNLWQAFYNSHWAAEGRRHIRMINMFGDPSMDIWLGVPKEMNVDYPQELPPGSNSIRIAVTDENEQPIEDAWVTIRQGTTIGLEDLFSTGYTDSEGIATYFFPNDTEGEVRVTVTKPDYIPHTGAFSVTGTPAVSFDNVTFNADINSGSQPDFVLRVRNHSNQAVNGVNGTISVESEYINITQNNSAFGNIAADGTADSDDDFTINIAPETPSGYYVLINLNLTDANQNQWLSRFRVTVNNAKLAKTQMIIDDDDDGILDPTEEANIFIYLQNQGDLNLEDVYGALTGGGYGLTVVSDTAYFGNIAVDQTVTSSERHILVNTSSFVMPGMNFHLSLHLFNEDGFSQTIPVEVPIGTVTIDDPLGPCEYGYWCYHSDDIDYVEAPEYEWIEIYPGLGGDGRNTNLRADWNNLQEYHNMQLPFTFNFYGEEYDIISISANGWISFGGTELSTQRNWLLPGPLGPSPIIAAFWDNLSLQNGGVYTYHDEEENKFIIQWQNARNVMNNAEETFQVILYDPEFYFTTTNDGPIKIQYKVVNNVNNGANTPVGLGNWGNFATVGIADHTATMGLQYTFNNRYPTAARQLSNESALYFATGSLGASPYVVIENFSYYDDNNNIPEFGETGNIGMTLRNIGGQDTENVVAILSSEDDYVNIIEDTAHFGDLDSEEADTINDAYTIEIAENIPDGHQITFYLSITTAEELNWNVRFNLGVNAPEFTSLTPFIHDPAPGGNDNGIVDPGEELTIFLPIRNVGGANSQEVEFSVTTDSDYAQIDAISETTFPTVLADNIMYPGIELTIDPQVTEGTGIVFDYEMVTGEYTFSGSFLVGIGGIIPIQIGEGEDFTGPSTASPINIYFQSLRGQTIYRAEELHAAGVTSGGSISSLGFYIHTTPEYSLPGFIVRMRHTEAAAGSEHIDEPYSTVYQAENYQPEAERWDMLDLDINFEWNGVDNILVDTAFDPVERWGNTGQVRYYEQENGFRFARQDSPSQVDVETDNVNSYKPQIRMMVDTSAGDASNRPEELTARFLNENSVIINWQAPDELEGLLGYNIYRNGKKINEEPLEETEYVDSSFEREGIIYYYATAVYEERETLPSNIVSVNFREIAQPQITPEEGNYYEPFDVTIITDTEDAEIFYTIDGEEPTIDDIHYTEPFRVDYHTTVRAIAYKPGSMPSKEAKVEYYILYEPQDLQAEGGDSSVSLTWNEPWSPERNRETDDDNLRAARNNVLDRSSSRAAGETKPSRSASLRRRASGERSESAAHRAVRYNVYRAAATGDFSLITDEPLQAAEYNDTGLAEGEYRYYVTAVYQQGESKPSATVNAVVGDTSAEDDDTVIAYETELKSAYPNPFNPETTILFTLSERAFVEIDVYDISGRRIVSLLNEEVEAGRHSIVWKGLDERNRRVSSGIYFYRMNTDGYKMIRKVVLLK